MPHELRLWQIDDNHLRECHRELLDLEVRLETWLEHDISVLSDDLLVIGRQVESAFGGVIDLLCIEGSGDLVIVELKRDKTPRDITAQALDYASWVSDLSSADIETIAERHFGDVTALDDHFKTKFGQELPDSLNQDHRMIIVASIIDPASERIIKYLSDTHGVNINAVTFQHFRDTQGKELLGRVFLIDPNEVDYQARTSSKSKRRPNLALEELEDAADRNGVGDLYRHLFSNLERHWRPQATTTSISFFAKLGKSHKVVFSLMPKDSSEQQGLRFQAYGRRLQEYLGISEQEMLLLLPQQREPWKAWEVDDPDVWGYAGYFANRDEVDRFINGLAGGTTLSD